MVPFAGAILLLHKTERLEPPTHYRCALFVLFVMLSPVLESPSIPLYVGLIAIPLAATAMGGASLGFWWTGIVLLLLTASAVLFPFEPAKLAAARNVVILSTGCGIALAINDRARDRALREVVSARRRADENLRVRVKVEQELVESQAVFVAAFHGAPSAVILSVVDTGEVLDVNETFVQTLGYEREEILGRTLAEFGIWPGPDTNEEWTARADEGRPFENVELALHTRSGEEIWFLTSAKELDIGARRCRLGQGVDVRERRRAGEVLERPREELESQFAERGRQRKASQAQLLENERLAAVGTLAAGIAHQINNPIGGIVAASKIALSEGGGSGLGLSVVHGVIGDHRGKVEIETRETGGTRFRILLPLARSVDRSRSDREQATPSPPV